MKRFLDFLYRISTKKWISIAGTVVLIATGVTIGVLYKSKEKPMLDEHGMPYVSDEEKAAIEKAKKDQKVKIDAAVKSIDSRFFTFDYGSEFLEYIKKLMPELTPKFEASYDNETNLQWLATLAQFSHYFIEFKGNLNNDLHNSDDYAILFLGKPYQNTSFKIAPTDKTASAEEVYDVETKYQDNSVDATAYSSLYERFGITNKDLSHANHILFLQKPINGEATIAFSKVAEYETGKFGILEEEQITRSNIKKIKEISTDHDLNDQASNDGFFQIIRFSSQGSWV